MKLSVDFGLIEDNGVFNQDKSIVNLLTTGISDLGVSNAYKHAIKVNDATSAASKASGVMASEQEQLQRVLGNEKAFIASQGKVNIA